MAFNLKDRDLLSLNNHSAREVHYLLDLARDLKRAKYAGIEQPQLTGKNIALIFEKASTRTRCAFEVAAHDQGAHVTYLGPSGSHIGHKESMKDTARVLGRMYDAIEYRGFSQKDVQILADYSGVPVFNGLTDEYHPTQMLADILTIQEHTSKPLSEVKFAYLGDGRNNMANSLLLICSKLGMDVRIVTPDSLRPTDEVLDMAADNAKTSGARVSVTADVDEGVKDADFVCTVVWVSMGEPVESWAERIDILLPYQINSKLLERTGNPDVLFMHCLPAFHNCETEVGREVAEQYPHLANGIEVTEDVFESDANIAFEEAENRMHSIKAVLVSSLS